MVAAGITTSPSGTELQGGRPTFATKDAKDAAVMKAAADLKEQERILASHIAGLRTARWLKLPAAPKVGAIGTLPDVEENGLGFNLNEVVDDRTVVTDLVCNDEAQFRTAAVFIEGLDTSEWVDGRWIGTGSTPFVVSGARKDGTKTVFSLKAINSAAVVEVPRKRASDPPAGEKYFFSPPLEFIQQEGGVANCDAPFLFSHQLNEFYTFRVAAGRSQDLTHSSEAL